MKMGSDQVKFNVVLQEFKPSGSIVRNVSLMKSNDKQRAISHFNEKLAEMSYYIENNARLSVIEYDDDGGFKVIRETKGR